MASHTAMVLNKAELRTLLAALNIASLSHETPPLQSAPYEWNEERYEIAFKLSMRLHHLWDDLDPG